MRPEPPQGSKGDQRLRPIEQYDRPAPGDSLDEDVPAEDLSREILDNRHGDRGTDAPSGPTGEITNMDVQHTESAVDHPETDPFHEGPGAEERLADVLGDEDESER